MGDNSSEASSSEDFLDVYTVNGNEESYRMSSSDLNSYFDTIDDYFSGIDDRVDIELAETGFLNYHRKGSLSEADEVVVYASSDTEELENRRAQLGKMVEIVLDKRHEAPDGEASVEVEFTDTDEYPYDNFRFLMPTHEAVENELKKARK